MSRIRIYILFFLLGIVSLSWAQVEGGFEWNYVASMDQARRGHAAVTYDGELYVFGGQTNRGRMLNTLEIYNPEADRWRPGPPMPRPLIYHTAAVVGNSIYIFGGLSSVSIPVADILSFTPEEGQRGVYHEIADMPEPRYSASAVVIDHRRILVMGGRSDRHIAQVTGFFYDVIENTTDDAPEFNDARANFEIVNYNFPIAIGGTDHGPVNSLEMLVDREWTQIGRMDIQTEHFSSELYGDTIMVVGGIGARRNILSVAVGFTISDRGRIRWFRYPGMRQLRADHSLNEINGNLYAVGGSSDDGNRNVSDEVEVYSYVLLAVEDDAIPATPTLFSAYPNPTNGFLTFSFPYGTQSIKVLDIAGRTMFEQTIGRGATKCSWNALSITAGSYYYVVESSPGPQFNIGRIVVRK